MNAASSDAMEAATIVVLFAQALRTAVLSLVQITHMTGMIIVCSHSISALVPLVLKLCLGSSGGLPVTSR